MRDVTHRLVLVNETFTPQLQDRNSADFRQRSDVILPFVSSCLCSGSKDNN